ncbi:MAG: hypothetical protein D3923_12715, partial [Candidatus Electrothrix sp. AR3]|nr:hypothetical protein [Candidatus Electrothrix sp. AR3]
RINKHGLVSKSTLLLSENVCAIDQDSKGRVWIASGLSHLGLRQAGLHYYDGKAVTEIILQNNIVLKKGESKNVVTTSLPKSTEFSGMIVNSNDEIVVVAAEIGLLSYTIGKSPKTLWEGNLYISYDMPTYGVGSFPQGIVEKEKKLYVASRSLGVFLFEALGDGKYIPTKQIVFRK